MMKRVQALCVVLAVVAGAAEGASAGWERGLVFARHLARRGARDLAARALERAATDLPADGPQRAARYERLASAWAALAVSAAQTTDGLEDSRAWLSRSEDFLQKYLDHPAVKTRPDLAPERLGARVAVAWSAAAVAAAHARVAAAPGRAEGEPARLRAQAVRIYEGAIAGLREPVAEQGSEVARLFGERPADPEKRSAWRAPYDAARQAHVHAWLMLNHVRCDLARLRKQAGEAEAAWKPEAQLAASELVQILIDYNGLGGIIRVNVPLAELREVLGADEEALERLADVWRARAQFAAARAIPCKARVLWARIRLRQGGHEEAAAAIGEMIAFRTRGAQRLDAKTVTAEGIEALLAGLDARDDPAQFDRTAVGGGLLVAAEAHAALGAAARQAGKPAAEVREHYARAARLGLGVVLAGVALEPRVPSLIETWRATARLTPSPQWLLKLGQDALREGRHDDAVRLFTDYLALDGAEPETVRRLWHTIAWCRGKQGRHYEAYTVFSALARWFPESRAAAYDSACFAAQALTRQVALTNRAFDRRLLEQAELDAEALSPGGRGWKHIRTAVAEREAGQFTSALDRLATIAPASPFYAYALRETAVTRKAIYDGLPTAVKREAKGRRARGAMVAAFQGLLSHCRAALPELSGEGRKRGELLSLAGSALAELCDASLADKPPQPTHVLALTAALTDDYPGIDGTRLFPRLLHARVKAAERLTRREGGDDPEQHIATLEAAWQALRKSPDSPWLPSACPLAARAYSRLGDRLAARARPAEATAARRRAGDLYVELLEAAPTQPIAVCRYALWHLLERAATPKTPDYAMAARLGLQALEDHKELRGSFPALRRLTIPLADARSKLTRLEGPIGLLSVQALTAAALCRLGRYPEALASLAEVEAIGEAVHRNRLARYAEEERVFKAGRSRRPRPRRPVREAFHRDARRWLARCILETQASTRYDAARAIHLDALLLYDRTQPEHWGHLYWLCETLRRQGRFEEIVKPLARAAWATEGRMGNGIVTDAKGSRTDFLALVRRLRPDVARLRDAARRQRLLPHIDALAAQLRE